MTDQEKKMLKNSIINIFENFNVLDHTATIGGLKNDILKFINSLQEEPVSKDLEEAANEWNTKAFDTPFYMTLDDNGNPNGVRQDYTTHAESFKAGAKWQKENLWKPADGDDLPEIDREVVVFTQDFPNDAGIMSVAIGHRPNPDGLDGKSITTGNVEHYTPETYGKGGWNIPNIVYWLDIELPKEI